jgi:hypothetical protein
MKSNTEHAAEVSGCYSSILAGFIFPTELQSPKFGILVT